VRKLQSITALAPPPAPEPFVASATRSSREQCELVRLAAELIDITPQRESTLLRCQVDGTVFDAFLAAPYQPVEDLLPGMKLQLAGICELMSTHPLIIPRNATAFRILLRDPQDIVILVHEPWWNEQRAAWILAALGILALAIAAWAGALQLMVRRQAGVIARQAEQKATLEERQRIARDLHDTLEQELVGVTMLLDTTSARLNEEQHSLATQPLHLARRLLRRAREESRSTIRELRSVTLEQRGLAAALDELLRPLAEANGVTRFSMEVTGKPRRLPGTVETHLLRIAQEAVANAARHAQAQNIQLHLSYDDPLTLEVKDDGQGFDPSQPTTSGHFGLSGMRERADKVSGTLTLTSALGKGTTVTLQLSPGI
jgi:signal transduction histidine kinase